MAKAGSGIGQTKSSTVGKFRVKPNNNNILEKEGKKISTTKSLILAQDER